MLVDAGTRHSGRRIFRQLRGQQVSTHVLTHAHPDHQGASKEVCERLGIQLWCGERDADAMESGNLGPEGPPDQQVITRAWAGPPHPVARRLREGDEVAGFTGAGRAGPLARPRRLLARVGPDADRGRRR